MRFGRGGTTEQWGRWRTARFVVGTELLTFIQLGGSFAAQRFQPHTRPLDAVAIVLLVAGPQLLLARRLAPRTVLVAVVAVTVGYLSAGYPLGPVFLSLVVALVTAVSQGHRWMAYGTVFGGLLLVAGIRWVVDPAGSPSLGNLAWLMTWLTLIAGFGDFRRVRRLQAAQAENAREEQSRRRESEERLRIARELHDVLAHHVSLINVQAGVALHLLDEQPERARPALSAIKDASRQVLQELRFTLGALRRVDESASRSPIPGLDKLDELVAGVRAAGNPVEVERAGPVRELPPSVDLAAYRIVQEALTNVHRHAVGASATVRVSYGADELTVRIRDTGGDAAAAAPGAAGGGNGIVGMRERAAALDGELHAGPVSGGGFEVLARLPIPAEYSPGDSASTKDTSGRNGAG